jgi:hypothetical protein
MTPHGGGYAAAGHLRAAPRLRGRPSGLNGRCRIAARRAHGPPLTPEPLRPLTEQRHGQAHGAARQARGARPTRPRSNPYNPVSTVSGDCQTRGRA